jgi:glycosyltransferase involved in cell wall biosynthesis
MNPLSVSIIVPNYNGEKFLANCLKSIISASSSSTQLLVVDGGSTDTSIDIIKHFTNEIDWWISEPDSGQSEAINKGMARATGDIVNWLCSDDLLAPGALDIVTRHFATNPSTDVLVGACKTIFTETGQQAFWKPEAAALDYLPCINPCPQPSTFYRRTLLDRSPPLREDLHYAMDFELWNYFKSRNASFQFVSETLSTYQMTGDNKTSVGGSKILRELWQILEEYHPDGREMRVDYERSRFRIDLARRRCKWRLFWKLTTPFYKLATRRLEHKYGAKTIEYLSRQVLRFAE